MLAVGYSDVCALNLETVKRFTGLQKIIFIVHYIKQIFICLTYFARDISFR